MSLGCSVNYVPGLYPLFTHGFRRGLHSYAASRLRSHRFVPLSREILALTHTLRCCSLKPEFLNLDAPATTVGEEVRRMADNIGMGRLWAGVHWRSDHEAGLKLGQVVACLVLRQLASICGGDFQLCKPVPKVVAQCKCEDAGCVDEQPPKCDDLKAKAKKCREACKPDVDAPDIPAPCPAAPQ